jgi:hypothetical protein
MARTLPLDLGERAPTDEAPHSAFQLDASFNAFFSEALNSFNDEEAQDVERNDTSRRAKWEKVYTETVVPLVESAADITLPVLHTSLGGNFTPSREKFIHEMYTWAGKEMGRAKKMEDGVGVIQRWVDKANETARLHEHVGQLEDRLIHEPDFHEEVERRKKDPEAYHAEYEYRKDIYDTVDVLAEEGSWFKRLGAFGSSSSVARRIGGWFRSNEENRALDVLHTPTGKQARPGEHGLGHSPSESAEAISLKRQEIENTKDAITLHELRKELVNHFILVTETYVHISGAVEAAVQKELDLLRKKDFPLDAMQRAIGAREKIIDLHTKRGIHATAGFPDKDRPFQVVRAEAIMHQKKGVETLTAQMEEYVREEIKRKMKEYRVHHQYVPAPREKHPPNIVPGAAPEREIPDMFARFENMERLGAKDKKGVLLMLAQICEELARDKEVMEGVKKKEEEIVDGSRKKEKVNPASGEIKKINLKELARQYREEAEKT